MLKKLTLGLAAAALGLSFAGLGAAGADAASQDRTTKTLTIAAKRDTTAEVQIAARKHRRCFPRVHARGWARGYGPHFVKKVRARRRAISNWRQKVRHHYGHRFARWHSARGKNVRCLKKGLGVRCHVAARPCRGGKVYW